MRLIKQNKKTTDLTNGEQFKFLNEQTNYEVVEWIYYRKIGTKTRKLLPNVWVKSYKTI